MFFRLHYQILMLRVVTIFAFLALGYFCESDGLPSVSGPCDPGSFCSLGASSKAPRDNITGNICPRGYYCPLNTSVPLPCPQGTYSNSEGLSGQHQCIQCDTGMYCESKHLTQPTGNCSAGYFCPRGQSQKQSEQYRYGFIIIFIMV